MGVPDKVTGRFGQKPTRLMFFRCDREEGHFFILPLYKKDRPVGGYEWIPCIIPGCMGKAATMEDLRHGYCGGCGSSVARDNPWMGGEIIRVRTMFATDAEFHVFKCPSCLGRDTFLNTHCAGCGARVPNVEPTYPNQHWCDTCKNW